MAHVFFVAIFALMMNQQVIANKACTELTIDYVLKSDICQLGGNSLRISYSTMQNDVVCNESISLTSPASQPNVFYQQAQQNGTYTLVMVDPDAPSSKGKYWLHWLVVDIKGSDLAAGNVNNGRVIDAYRRPSPPEGSGIHRYQFYLANQPTWQTDVKRNGTSRGMFDLVHFLSENGLCEPIAGNQFRTQYEKVQ